MDRLLRSLLLIGAAQGLAIDGDHLDRGLGQSRRPGDEAALKRRRVEGGENVAQVIMSRRTMLRIPTDSASHPVVTNFFARSPWRAPVNS
jgi:hypothetical protein